MRTAAHSCLMTRKSLGGARTTAATTELRASATEEDVSETSEAAADAAALCPPDELRHRRLHFRPFPPACLSFSAAGLSPTSVLIHFPDAPIDRSKLPSLALPLELRRASTSLSVNGERPKPNGRI